MGEPVKFDKLPEGYRLAVKDDFFDKFGLPRTGMQFIMQSFQDETYHEGKPFQMFTIKSTFVYDKIAIWIDSERAWVKKETTEPENKNGTDNLMKRIDFMFVD